MFSVIFHVRLYTATLAKPGNYPNGCQPTFLLTCTEVSKLIIEDTVEVVRCRFYGSKTSIMYSLYSKGSLFVVMFAFICFSMHYIVFILHTFICHSIKTQEDVWRQRDSSKVKQQSGTYSYILVAVLDQEGPLSLWMALQLTTRTPYFSKVKKQQSLTSVIFDFHVLLCNQVSSSFETL